MRRVFGAALMAVLLCVTGCLNLGGGPTPPTRYYLLTTATIGPLDAAPATLLVGPVTVPGYLDRPQILTRENGEQVQIAEFDRWAEPLPDSVPRVLTDDLAAALPTWTVSRGAAAATGKACRLSLSVARFDGHPGGDVVLEARWRVAGLDEGRTINHASRIIEPTGGAGYDALVSAMSRALGKLALEVGTAIASAPRGPGAA